MCSYIFVLFFFLLCCFIYSYHSILAECKTTPKATASKSQGEQENKVHTGEVYTSMKFKFTLNSLSVTLYMGKDEMVCYSFTFWKKNHSVYYIQYMGHISLASCIVYDTHSQFIFKPESNFKAVKRKSYITQNL